MYQTPYFEPIERTFNLTDQASRRVRISMLVAGMSSIAAATGVAMEFARPLHSVALHFAVPFPATVALAAVVNIFRLRRSPTSLIVGRNGIQVERNGDRRDYSWEEVGWSKVCDIEPPGHQQLVVYDVAGSSLLKLTDAIDDFDELVRLVRLYTAMTPGSRSEEFHRKRVSRAPYIVIAAGIVLLPLSAFLAWNTWDTQRTARLLETAAIPGNATIVRLFLASDGVTRRLEYRVNAAGRNPPIRNVEITEALWLQLKGAQTVPVLFVPNEPEISRLTDGEVPRVVNEHSPIFDYGLALAMSLFALLFLCAGLLNASGWNVEFDHVKRRFCLKPYGMKS